MQGKMHPDRICHENVKLRHARRNGASDFHVGSERRRRHEFDLFWFWIALSVKSVASVSTAKR
jgi:hypothetical protein